jgi:hypothetical protein
MKTMKTILAAALLFVAAYPLAAQVKHGLRDAEGRHVIPRGFVVVTNARDNEKFFDADDYLRMVRMGANYQVIRLELGKLSDFPGARVDDDYLLRLDRLVELGRNYGIRTVFEMTSYGVGGFHWEAFWRNGNGEQQRYLEAWKLLWSRYKDDDSVAAYDLINEPRKEEMEITYDALTADYLVPAYRMLIDEKNKIDPVKPCLIQAIFMNKGDAIEHNQYAEFKVPVGRENIIFSPHIYLSKAEWVEPVLRRLQKEADMLDAPMLIGEWGFPIFEKTDASYEEQLEYSLLYAKTVEAFDRLGVGTIKAWFSGNPSMQNFLPGGRSTWAIFSDRNSIGTVERKYITDAISRPYPQSIAGDIQSFAFDFAARTLDISILTDNSKGASRVFVGADRHYPDGFTIECGEDLTLCHNPLKNVGLEVLTSDANGNPADFIWDEARQQLIILQWPKDGALVHLKIRPGIGERR